MTIKEIEAHTGLPRASVRYYESEGLIHPSRGSNGYRDYSPEDLTILLKIKLLRQLDCSLEDIRALQNGDRPLDWVLAQRLADLEHRQADLAQARQLCERLRADRADWTGLDPLRYLDWTPDPPPEETADIRSRIPWRRFLSRSLDFTLCALIWRLILGAGFRVNILQRGTGDKLVDIAAALGLMLLLEPLFLHRFGATPGKWVLGLRLTRSDGSYFSVREGFQRTWKALLMGWGLMVPLLSLGALILSFLRCRRGREQPWASEDEVWSDGTDGRTAFWETRGSGKRAAAYAGIYILAFFLFLSAQWAASIPWHQGTLTLDQFIENYNHLRDFSSPNAYGLSAYNMWTWTEPDTYVLRLFGPDTVDLYVETEADTVTAVFYSVIDWEQGSPRNIPSLPAVHALNALLGKGEMLIPGPRRELLSALSLPVPGTRRWEAEGWTVIVALELEGYHAAQDSALLFPEEGQVQLLRYSFRIEQTNPGL